MPGRVYVAGPVWDPAGYKSAPAIYADLDREAALRGWSVSLPERERELDELQGSDFTKAITDRIDDAQCVVTVLSPDDQSAPVEATIASYIGKEQGVVVVEGARAPRVLAGLPGVVQVVDAEDEEAVSRLVERLVEGQTSSWPA
jgi:hypothetical protein